MCDAIELAQEAHTFQVKLLNEWGFSKEAAVLAYNEVSSKLDKSITSNLHHKNYVSRQKARLSKAVNSVQ